MEMTRKTMTFKAEGVSDTGSFVGIANATGVLDSHNEIVDPGAFAATIKAHKQAGTMPALLWQHFSDSPIGVIKALKETEVGLEMEAQLLVNDIQKAKEAHALLRHNAMNGLSIGFMVSRADMEMDDDDVTHIKEVDLVEVSVVTFPANRDSIVTDVKQCKDWTLREFESFLRDSGRFSRSEATGVAKHGFLGIKNSDENVAHLLEQISKVMKGD